METSDIDVQTTEEGAYEIGEILSDYRVQEVYFKESEDLRSHFGVFNIQGVKVEVMGDVQKKWKGEWEKPVSISEHRKFVDFEELEIPVLSLDYEAEAYRKIGRKEKAEKISRYKD